MRNDPLPLYDPGGLGIFNLMAKALAAPSYRPDSRASRERLDRAATAPKSSTPEPTKPSMPELSKASTSQADKTAPRRVGLMERLERWFWLQQQRDIEAYLAQSADIHELEVRMRNLERGRWHRYN